MNRFILRLALAISAAGAVYGQTVPAHPLAYVQVKTADSKGINLHKYSGKEMILFLFSTECEDCLKTLTVMNKIQQEHGAQKLQVIGIGINNNAPYQVTSWVQRFKPAFPVGFIDQDATIKLAAMKPDDRAFVPIVIFVDGTGTVRVQYAGNNPVFKDQATALPAIAGGLLRTANKLAPAPKAAPKTETKPNQN